MRVEQVELLRGALWGWKHTVSCSHCRGRNEVEKKPEKAETMEERICRGVPRGVLHLPQSRRERVNTDRESQAAGTAH